MRSYLYIYVTHDDRFFKSLIDSCEKVGIQPVVKGMGDKWINYRESHRRLLQFLDTLNDDDVVINVDGFDSLVVCPLDEIVNRFLKMNCKAVFSGTSHCKSIIKKYVQWKMGFYGDDKVNSGMFMGYVSKIKEIVQKLVNSDSTNDQVAANEIVRGDPEVLIDNDRILFCNITSIDDVKVDNGILSFRGATPCIISAPGCVNLNPLIKKLGGIRTSDNISCDFVVRINEFLKYFIPEIIVLLLVFYILLRNMKRVRKILFG